MRILSLNAMHRCVMVFSNEQNKAIEKMNELVANKEIIKRNSDWVETKDGTFQARIFNEGCRGYRYREVYVDESLKDNEDTMFLIRAKLVPPHYYSNVEKDENYNWRDHIHYFKGDETDEYTV